MSIEDKINNNENREDNNKHRNNSKQFDFIDGLYLFAPYMIIFGLLFYVDCQEKKEEKIRQQQKESPVYPLNSGWG